MASMMVDRQDPDNTHVYVGNVTPQARPQALLRVRADASMLLHCAPPAGLERPAQAPSLCEAADFAPGRARRQVDETELVRTMARFGAVHSAARARALDFCVVRFMQHGAAVAAIVGLRGAHLRYCALDVKWGRPAPAGAGAAAAAAPASPAGLAPEAPAAQRAPADPQQQGAEALGCLGLPRLGGAAGSSAAWQLAVGPAPGPGGGPGGLPGVRTLPVNPAASLTAGGRPPGRDAHPPPNGAGPTLAGALRGAGGGAAPAPPPASLPMPAWLVHGPRGAALAAQRPAHEPGSPAAGALPARLGADGALAWGLHPGGVQPSAGPAGGKPGQAYARGPPGFSLFAHAGPLEGLQRAHSGAEFCFPLREAVPVTMAFLGGAALGPQHIREGLS